MTKKEIIGICEFLKIHHFENAYNLLDYIEKIKQENQQLKKQKDDVIKFVKGNTYSTVYNDYSELKEEYVIQLLRMLGEIE